MADGQDNLCAYPWQQMIVDLTGEVVPCCFWSGYGNSGKPLGNTNLNSLDEIWNGPDYKRLRLHIINNNTEGFPCHDCLAYKWGQGQYPRFVWPNAMENESGFCYRTRLPDSFLAAARAEQGAFELLEDGQPLGPGESLHDDVRQAGLGRFSFWGDYLYFSTSDNSDPRSSGKSYEVRRGGVSCKLPSIVADSVSGRNVKLAYQEFRERKEELQAKPTMLSFIGTADCNIDCGFCSQNKVRKLNVRHRPETEPDVLAHVPYLTQFIWHGGEPFLIRAFREFYERFEAGDNPNLTFGFTSNGVMITERVLEKLKKFPRLNASVSMDSFRKETFERIRAGANFDTVWANVARLLGAYDAPDRVFSVGSVVMKSNVRELADNVRFAVEHDVGVNFGPLVIYPSHERLDVFADFEAESAGWQRAIDEAREAVREAVAARRKAVLRVNPMGMIDAIEDILRQARERYRETVVQPVEIVDPTNAIAAMPLPYLQIVSPQAPNSPLSYLRLTGAGRFAVRLPAREYLAPGRGRLAVYPDIHDELEVQFLAEYEQGRRVGRPLRVVVPPYQRRERPRNLAVARKPGTMPLHMVDLEQLDQCNVVVKQSAPPPGLLERALRRFAGLRAARTA